MQLMHIFGRSDLGYAKHKHKLKHEQQHLFDKSPDASSASRESVAAMTHHASSSDSTICLTRCRQTSSHV